MGAHWYFDFVSPFSYLHWQKMQPLVEAGRVEAVPIVFGAVLHALGILGPAEIPKTREFIYRQALWQARRDGVTLRFPPAHPFNPLPALRLCVAAGATPPAIGTVFEAIWAEGLAGDAPLVLDGLAARLGLADAAAAIADPVVKDRLRANTDAALAAGVFGVPTLAVEGELFWGNDSHDLMLAVLEDPGLLRQGELAGVAAIPVGVERRR